MAKKPTAKTARRFVADEVELRRWCVEQAIRWPVVIEYGNAGAYSAAGGFKQVQTDADVIGRAKKIHDWVTAP